MSDTITLSDNNFDEQIKTSEIPVLVDFWAEWCAPCKMMAPVIEEIAGQYKGKIKVGKLDVDSNPKTASKYGIRSIPSVLIFKDGRILEQIIGAVPKKQITKKLDAVLEKK